jgi:hypothetical protein
MNSTDIKVKREQVRVAYEGYRWNKKVRAMSDKRILAIWCRLFKNKPKRKEKFIPFYCE